jgi:putative flippase GtrA
MSDSEEEFPAESNENSKLSPIAALLARQPALVQFVKFGLVGLLNTGLSYGIANALHYLIGLDEQQSNIVAWIITVFISYMLNSQFVFKPTGEKHPFWRSLFKVYVSYVATGLILIPLLTHLENNVFGLPYYLITRINIPISVP